MNNKFIKNTSWIVGAQILKSLIGFVVNIFTAKMLGPSNYGIIGYVTSIITLFTAVANLGLTDIIVKELVSKKDKEGKIIGTAITMQLISSAISYAMVIFVVVILNPDDKIMLYCALLQSIILITNSFNHINYYYQAQLKSKISSIISLIAYMIMQIYRVYLLITNKSVIWFASAFTLDYVIVAIVLIAYYFYDKGPKWQFDKTIIKNLLKQSIPLILAGSITVIYTSVDRIMLKELLGSTEPVGYYDTAYTVSHAWQFIATAIITSIVPLVYESLNKNGEDSVAYRTRLRQMYFMVFWLGACASIAIDIFANLFFKLTYGEAYNASIVPAMIMTWSAVFASIGYARSINCICEHKQKYIILFSINTVVLNVILNWILIPRIGVVGAAIATLASEICANIISPLLFKKTRNIGVNILQAMFFKGINIKSLIGVFKNKFFKKKQTATVENSQDNSQANQSEQSDVAVDNQEKEIEIEIQQIVDDIDKDNDAEA